MNFIRFFVQNNESPDKLVILIFGVIFICVGLVLVINELSLRNAYSASTIGYISDIRIETDSDQYEFFINYVAYNVDGVEYFKKSPIGRTRNKSYVGQQTLVYYNPNNPEQCLFKIDKLPSILLASSLIVMGLLPFFLG